jgi:predicted tellurium resistance membrane protein TerC
MVQITEPVFTALEHGFSWRDMILIAGGLFLIWKVTKEIHPDSEPGPNLFEGQNLLFNIITIRKNGPSQV